MRHHKIKDMDNQFYTKLGIEHGAKAVKFIHHISNQQASQVINFMKTEFDIDTLTAFRSIVYAYTHGVWGGGYGGKAWASVADCVLKFFDGTYTPEIFVDTVWTLCHNNGPIFNKPYVYRSYTSDFMAVLDVQRAGMIPNLIYDSLQKRVYLKSFPMVIPQALLNQIKNFLADPKYLSALNSIDWYMVEKLGALKSYYQFKKQQDSYNNPGIASDCTTTPIPKKTFLKKPVPAGTPIEKVYTLGPKLYKVIERISA